MKNALLWLEDHKDWGIEMLRMYLGVVLILKGFYFIRDMNSLLALIGLQSSLWLGGIFAHYIVLAHLIGGLSVIIGLLTRIVAAFQVPILLGACYVVFNHDGILSASSNFEFTSLVLILLVMFVFYGGGRLSVDYFLGKPKD